MLDQIRERDQLLHVDATTGIDREFGREFLYLNDNNHWAIRQPVLDAFEELTAGTVVWERRGLYWRKRREEDAQGRAQP